jgi:signal transduction histidine kinase
VDSLGLRPLLAGTPSPPPGPRWGWLLVFDWAFLLLEQLTVLRLGQLLFPQLQLVQPVFIGLLVVGALLWLAVNWRLRAPLIPLPLSPRLRPHRGSREQVVYRAATRLAIHSLGLRVLLVTGLSVGLGSYAALRQQLPMAGVAFLLWTAALLTPLIDAWRALLYEQAARRWLSRLLATRLSLRLPSLSPVELEHAYLLDTYQGRLLLASLGLLGIALALATLTIGLSLPSWRGLPGGEAALPQLLFWTPPLAILLLAMGLCGLHYAARPLSRCLAVARRNPDPLTLDPTQASLDPPARWVAERLPSWLVASKLAAFAVAAFLLGGLALFRWQAPLQLVALLLSQLLLCLLATLYVEWPWQTAQLAALTPPHLRLRRLRRPLSTAALLLPAAALPLLLFVGMLGGLAPLAGSAIPLRLLMALLPIGGGAALLGWWLRQLSRPLATLTAEAVALSSGLSGNLPVATPGPGGAPSSGQLASALSAMQQVLRERLLSDTQAQARLAAEVAERTVELQRRNSELEQALAQLGAAQQSLLQAEKLASIGRLVAGITHEINNPINAVVNTVQPLRQALRELLADRASGAPAELFELRQMVGVLHRSSRRTHEIVQALYRYAQGGDDAPIELDLKTLLDGALELVQHPLKSELVVVADYALAQTVKSLGGQLQQVFVNLLDNALAALAERRAVEPSLVVRLELSATVSSVSQLTVVVRDNGAGIPAKVLPRIFDPFFTTKDAAEGWGLGLSIVDSILRRHGGQIRVETLLGQGTSFLVTLPLSGGPLAVA